MSQSVRGVGSDEEQSRHEIEGNSLFQNHNVQAIKAPEMQGSHSSDLNKLKPNTLISPARYEMALRAVVNRTLSLLDAEHCSIALIDKQTGELVTQASSRVYMTDSTRQSRFPLRHGIAGHVAATGQAFLCGDVRRTGHYLKIGNDEITSIMCAPIVHKKQVLGTITVTSPRYDAFTTDHLQLLEEMADQEAVGIAQLFHSDASLRQTEKLTSLLQLNQITANATVRESLITRVIDWLSASFENSEIAITLFGNRPSENAFFGSPIIAPLLFSRELRTKTRTVQFFALDEDSISGQDYYNELQKRGLHSFGLAPLYRQKPDNLIGLIIILLPQTADLVGPSDEEILEEASDKLSEGIETAERFQQTQETRMQLSQFTQGANDPVVKLDLAGQVSDWNEAAELLFGYTAPEIIGQLLPGDNENEEELLARVREGATLANVLIEKQRKDGQILSLSVTLAPIVDSEGTVESISLLVKDITETTRLKQEAARRNQEMSNLSEIALRLASTLDNNNLLYLIHDHLSHLIEFDALYVASYDEVKQVFELQLHHEIGVYFAPENWPATDPVMAWLLQHRRQLVIDSSDNDLPLERFRNMEGAVPATLLITPTKLDDQVSGFIAIANYEPQPPLKQYHKQLMLIVATQAAIAMEKARILRRSQLKTEQLTILRQVAKVTSSSLELNEVLINTIRELHRHVSFSWAYCQVFGADGLYRQFVKDYDRTDKEPEIQFGSLGLSLKEVSEQFNQAIFVTDLDSKFPHHRRILELYVDNKMRSGILTPLWYGERCIGIILLGTRQDYFFNDDELGLISDIAAQANVAIENAQLHELVKIQVEQLALQTTREHKLLTETNHQKEQLEAIFGNSSDGLMQIDENRNVLRLNAAMASFVGAKVTDTGRKCTEILRCQDKEGNLLCEISCPLQKVLERRQPLQHHEISLDNQAGVRRTVSGNWSVVTGGADGNNVVTTMRDVTALREVEQLKANFISMVSHELRNPINVINGFTKMLAEGRAGELNPLQQEFIGSVLVSVSQLKKLAEDILDLSRADAGRFGVNMSQISLKEIILKNTNNIKPMIYAKNIRLITGQLPENDCMINADEMRLGQLIGNLFENAIKFTPQGGRIMVELKLLNDEVTVSIKDSGIGIAPEHLSHIFERFYQVQDEDTRRMRGTQLGSGLGLSICKEIVERHGGRIWVESTQGKGTTFSFTIPLLKS